MSRNIIAEFTQLEFNFFKVISHIRKLQFDHGYILYNEEDNTYVSIIELDSIEEHSTDSLSFKIIKLESGSFRISCDRVKDTIESYDVHTIYDIMKIILHL